MSQELCGPCKDAGITAIAHYSGVPAGKSSTGKAVPAKCYYHHFNMPLPKSIAEKSSKKPAEESGAPADPEDAPPPATPTKAKAVTLTQPESKPKEATMPVGEPCKCGCGEPQTSNASPYIKGHNPNTKPKNTKRPGSPPRKTSSKRPAWMNGGKSVATIQVPESHLDAWWNKLLLEEKAEIFSKQFES